MPYISLTFALVLAFLLGVVFVTDLNRMRESPCEFINSCSR